MSHCREDLQFSSGADACAAWLYPAAGDADPAPIIVMAHGLSGTRRDRLGAFGSDSRQRGWPRSCSTIAVSATARASRTCSNPNASSMTGARPSRSPASCRTPTRTGSRPSGRRWAEATRSLRPQRIRGWPRPSARFPFSTEIARPTADHPRSPPPCWPPPATTAPASRGQPDEAAFIRAPGAEAGWRHVVAIGEDSRWRNRVSAAWLVGAPFDPIRHADTLHCPWLVCVAADDQVAKPGPAIDAARRAPYGELRVLPRSRSLRHLRRSTARGGRHRRTRVPSPSPAAEVTHSPWCPVDTRRRATSTQLKSRLARGSARGTAIAARSHERLVAHSTIVA